MGRRADPVPADLSYSELAAMLDAKPSEALADELNVSHLVLDQLLWRQ